MAFFARLLRTAVATGFREADAGWRTGGAEQLPATRRKRSGSEICHCMHSSAEPSLPTSSSGTFTPPWLYSISCGWLKRIQPGKGEGPRYRSKETCGKPGSSMDARSQPRGAGGRSPNKEGVFFHSLFFFFCSLFFFSVPLVPWSFGPLVLWSRGPLVPWSFGPVVPWSSGSPGQVQPLGPLVFSSI